MRLLLFTALLYAASGQRDPVEDFCRRHLHQTCIIDNKLYIDGGKVYYGGSVENDSTVYQNTHLLWENVLATDNDTPFPKQFKNLTKSQDVPSVSGGVLWPDATNKLFYLYGGEFHQVADVQPFRSLWFFDVIYNTWNRTTPSTSQTIVSWPAFGSGTVTDEGVAYYYGGYLSNKTVPSWGSAPPLMLSSLVAYNMNDQSWSNRTQNVVPRAEGILHYLPISRSGTLVYFGGLQGDGKSEPAFANMSDIHLFDINDNRWYTQRATGDIPQPRRGACATVIWPKDRSSFNFYMWGGIGVDGRAVAELYILTLPSFQWTRIFPNTSSEVPHYNLGRGWSSCNIVRDSQMIIMGGEFTNTSYVSCDVPEIGAQNGVLLGQESVENGQWWWQTIPEYNGYRVPDKLVSLVGGNVSGYATKTTPVLGWTTPTLSEYFVNGANYARPRTATRAVQSSSTSTSPTKQPSSSGPNAGAIAGGTVGGVIALGAVIAVAFFCLRSKHRRKTAHNPPELDNTQRPELDGPAMTQKPAADCSVSEGDAIPSSVTPTPAYSAQASPPMTWNSEYMSHQADGCTQQATHPYIQTYHSAPPDHSMQTKQLSAYEIRSELPDVTSPANAELSEVRSPTNAELPESREQVTHPGHD